MGYSVKWITENMGITRDMLKYYEKEKLLSVKESRNVTNNHREYNDEDLEKIRRFFRCFWYKIIFYIELFLSNS